MFRAKPNREIARLKKQLSDCIDENDKLARKLEIVEFERDALAAVVARDRSRVLAETAEHNARRAALEPTR